MAIGTLDGFALISQEIGGETYIIHSLVQVSVHYWLEQKREKADYAGRALQLLVEEFPNSEYEYKKTCKSMLAHAQAVLCHNCISENDMRYRAALLYNVGRFNWRQGRYVSAYQAASESYDIYRERGEIATKTLDSLTLHGLVLQSQGKYEAAEQISRRALEGTEKVLGVEHPRTLISVNNLASVLQEQEKYETAEGLHRRNVEVGEKALGEEHPETLTCVNNLALVLQEQGKYEAAEKLYRRALEASKKMLGVEHAETLITVNNQAVMLQR